MEWAEIIRLNKNWKYMSLDVLQSYKDEQIVGVNNQTIQPEDDWKTKMSNLDILISDKDFAIEALRLTVKNNTRIGEALAMFPEFSNSGGTIKQMKTISDISNSELALTGILSNPTLIYECMTRAPYNTKSGYIRSVFSNLNLVLILKDNPKSLEKFFELGVDASVYTNTSNTVNVFTTWIADDKAFDVILRDGSMVGAMAQNSSILASVLNLPSYKITRFISEVRAKLRGSYYDFIRNVMLSDNGMIYMYNYTNQMMHIEHDEIIASVMADTGVFLKYINRYSEYGLNRLFTYISKVHLRYMVQNIRIFEHIVSNLNLFKISLGYLNVVVEYMNLRETSQFIKLNETLFKNGRDLYPILFKVLETDYKNKFNADEHIMQPTVRRNVYCNEARNSLHITTSDINVAIPPSKICRILVVYTGTEDDQSVDQPQLSIIAPGYDVDISDPMFEIDKVSKVNYNGTEHTSGCEVFLFGGVTINGKFGVDYVVYEYKESRDGRS